MFKSISMICIVVLLFACDAKKKMEGNGNAQNTNRNVDKNIIDTLLYENIDSLKIFAKAENDKSFRGHFETDSLIKNDSVFQKLDSIVEIKMPHAKAEDNQKRSLELYHYSTTNNQIADQFHIQGLTKDIGKISIARAYLNRSGKLIVKIGFTTGFEEEGFKLCLFQGKFYTIPYYSDDIISEEDKESLNYPFFQKLTLNKSTYMLGDSIYGRIAFRSIFYNKYQEASKHDVSGYFRAKIEKQYW